MFVGEELTYQHSDFKVHLRLHVSSTGVEVLSDVGTALGLQRLCVGTLETKTLDYIMAFTQLGSQKISGKEVL